MAGILHLVDLNPVGPSRKFMMPKRHYDGLEAPRNSLELSMGLYPSPSSSNVDEDIPFSYELSRHSVSSTISRDGISVRVLIENQISNEPEVKQNAPSVVARLMGVDNLPSEVKPIASTSSRKLPHERTKSLTNKELVTRDLNFMMQGPVSRKSKQAPSKKRDNSHSKSLLQDHPQERELQKFKKEFEAWQAYKVWECSSEFEFDFSSGFWKDHRILAQETLNKEKMARYADTKKNVAFDQILTTGRQTTGFLEENSNESGPKQTEMMSFTQQVGVLLPENDHVTSKPKPQEVRFKSSMQPIGGYVDEKRNEVSRPKQVESLTLPGGGFLAENENSVSVLKKQVVGEFVANETEVYRPKSLEVKALPDQSREGYFPRNKKEVSWSKLPEVKSPSDESKSGYFAENKKVVSRTNQPEVGENLAGRCTESNKEVPRPHQLEIKSIFGEHKARYRNEVIVAKEAEAKSLVGETRPGFSLERKELSRLRQIQAKPSSVEHKASYFALPYEKNLNENNGPVVPTKIVILKPGPEKFDDDIESEAASVDTLEEEEESIEDFLEEVKQKLLHGLRDHSVKDDEGPGSERSKVHFEVPPDPKEIAQQIAKQVRESVARDLRLGLYRSESTRSQKSDSQVEMLRSPEFINRETRKFLTDTLTNVVRNDSNEDMPRRVRIGSMISPSERNAIVPTMKEFLNHSIVKRYSYLNGVRDDTGIKWRSFGNEQEDGSKSDDVGVSPRNLIRCRSAPVSRDTFGELLLSDQPFTTDAQIRRKHEGDDLFAEIKKSKRNRFNIRGKVSNLRCNLTLGGKWFGRKAKTVERGVDEFGFTRSAVTSPSHARNLGIFQENSTEVPPSPASVYSVSRDETFSGPTDRSSPISTLDLPFTEEASVPGVFGELSSDLRELRRQLNELRSRSQIETSVASITCSETSLGSVTDVMSENDCNADGETEYDTKGDVETEHDIDREGEEEGDIKAYADAEQVDNPNGVETKADIVDHEESNAVLEESKPIVSEAAEQTEEPQAVVAEDKKKEHRFDIAEQKEGAETYIKHVLMTAGLYENSGRIRLVWDVSTTPVKHVVFNEVEKSYEKNTEKTWEAMRGLNARKMERRLLFDLLNEVLTTKLLQCSSVSAQRGLINSFRVSPGRKLLVDGIWRLMDAHVHPQSVEDNTIEDLAIQEICRSPWTKLVQDQLVTIGKDMESMILNELIEEITTDLRCL